MTIQQGIWKIGDQPQKLIAKKLENELQLEDQIFKDISILHQDWMLIGRQVFTGFGKYIDLLAIDASGSVMIIELKRDKTPRDVVAQTLDYASWVVDLSETELIEIYSTFVKQYDLPDQSLDKAFSNKFGGSIEGIELNSSHQMFIVASELDLSTERIIRYLNDHAGIGINAVFFHAFEDQNNLYLSRAWMIDPTDTQEKAVSVGEKSDWNKEFYVSFGHGERRNWGDAVKYGFISAGNGPWYSRTLNMLKPGDRIWVNIPGTGYVGMGYVTGEMVSLDDLKLSTGESVDVLKTSDSQVNYQQFEYESEDETEYFVSVDWKHTETVTSAFSELGLFGNQNTVCKPRTPKWVHTVERLIKVWEVSG